MFNVGMPAKLLISSVSLLPGNFWSQKEQPVIWKLETMSPRGSSKRDLCKHGPLTRYIKLRVAHAPGMPETFSPPPTSKETASYRSQHASRHVRHARAWCMPGSLTRGGGKNVPGIPGACAIRNFTYLARGPCRARLKSVRCSGILWNS